ncbi:MAG: RNA pseudouridine synthase [Chitinophagaceae bacterium]|nr:RNA pseudouridine synthase [Chitinophagaceae bacterium]
MKLTDLVISETDEHIALNKPSGLLSIPDREGKEISLKALLQEKYDHIFTVHRLDRDTSGVIVFAKNEAIHKHLSRQFEERFTEKIYVGMVVGSPPNKSGTINAPIAENMIKRGVMLIHQRGKESITDYEVLEDFGLYSWMQFRIHTGRTHQIRVHMQSVGHPLVCDVTYGDGKPVLLSSLKHKKFKLSRNELDERPLMNRLALHAARLSIDLPSGERLVLEATLPRDMNALLQQVRKWGKK